MKRRYIRLTLRFKLLNLCSCVFSMISLLITIFIYENSSDLHENVINLFKENTILLALINISNGISIILMILYQRYVCYPYKKTKSSLFFHSILLILSPSLDYPLIICTPFENICYSMNELIILIMLLRLIPFLLSLLQFSPYYHIYNPENFPLLSPSHFALKTLFTRRKYQLNLLIFISLMTLFSYASKITERRRKSPDGFESFDNCLWHSFVSGFGIGFGDYFPITFIGRTLTTIWIFLGAATSWYFIVGIGELCTLNNMEYLIYKDINIITKAANLIKKFMLKQAYAKELLEFKQERSRHYPATLNFKDLIFKIKNYPPKDFRILDSKIAKLEKNYEDILNELIIINKNLTYKERKNA